MPIIRSRVSRMLDLSPFWFMDAIWSSYFKIKIEPACYLWQPKSQLLKQLPDMSRN